MIFRALLCAFVGHKWNFNRESPCDRCGATHYGFVRNIADEFPEPKQAADGSWSIYCCSGCHGCCGAPVGYGYETKLDAMLGQIKWLRR